MTGLDTLYSGRNGTGLLPPGRTVRLQVDVATSVLVRLRDQLVPPRRQVALAHAIPSAEPLGTHRHSQAERTPRSVGRSSR